jgi:hypothetical protein
MTNELEVHVEATVDRLPEDLPEEWLTELEQLGLWVGKSEYERIREERQLIADFWEAIRAAIRDLLTRRHEAAQFAAKKH